MPPMHPCPLLRLPHAPAAAATHLQEAELVAGAGVEGGHHLTEGPRPTALKVPRLGGL